jgi:hypothetical protein
MNRPLALLELIRKLRAFESYSIMDSLSEKEYNSIIQLAS